MRGAVRSVLVVCVAAFAADAQTGPAPGPLRVLEANPRYFTDGSGRAVYLAGSHNWHNFQDNGHRLPGTQDPPPVFDYKAYLDLLQAYNHNFFRLWRWEAPKWMDDDPPGIKYCTNHPWVRSGPGLAADEKPKFNLDRYDPAFFDRMRSRIILARDRGIYVSVMLFEGWETRSINAWTYHPFNITNNVNGVDGSADKEPGILLYYTLHDTPMAKRVLALQEAYVRKIVDTVNNLDNVLYEICNEPGG